MAKMKCPCKYTYDPEKGDPKQGIPPGTQFEDLPWWTCKVVRRPGGGVSLFACQSVIT